jgi:type VI secretion system Hcp family effector
MAMYMKVTGKTQGVLAGGVTSGSYTGQILVLSANFGMGVPQTSTGLVTGRQVVRPLVITKHADKSTPLLLNCVMNNEVATAILITFTIEGATSGGSRATLALTNAMVHDFTQYSQPDGLGLETISFTYQTAEYTWITPSITSSWDLASPTSS